MLGPLTEEITIGSNEEGSKKSILLKVTEKREESEKILNRAGDAKAYTDALDMMFGIDQTKRTQDEIDKIKINANKAAMRQFGNAPGRIYYLSDAERNDIVGILGEHKVKENLSTYKTEVEEKILHPEVTPSSELTEHRNDAKFALFSSGNVSYITFV